MHLVRYCLCALIKLTLMYFVNLYQSYWWLYFRLKILRSFGVCRLPFQFSFFCSCFHIFAYLTKRNGGFVSLIYIYIYFLYLFSNFNHLVSVNVQYVMIVLKGSIPISFGGTEEPAAYGELVSIGGLNPDTNKKLSGAIATILESKLSVSKSRFFLKFYDTKASYLNFLSCHEEGLLLCTSFFSLHFSFLFRHIKLKNMHSVCMLYTRTRSCK
jgi:hypothetical protein